MNAAELCTAAVRSEDEPRITMELAEQLTQRSAMRYDRDGDAHYDILSAFQKSMRGSDPDAALHYLARLLEAGDLASACRRLMVCACEDVGLAWPQIIPIVKAAVDAAMMVGLPEARIPLADAVILTAMSLKKASFTAIRTITRIIGSTSSIFRMPCSALRTITTETTKTSRRLTRIGKT